MRGCLRLVGADFTTWAEIPSDYWAGVAKAGAEIPTIPEPKMIPGSETPDYGGKSSLFCYLNRYMHACEVRVYLGKIMVVYVVVPKA